MNETAKHVAAIFGVQTTLGSLFIALLPTINLIVQILAGVTAIVVGYFTARYYYQKVKSEFGPANDAGQANKTNKGQ